MATDQLNEHRLGAIEDALKSISDSLQKLAALELKHLETREALGRAFDQIDDKEQRLRVVELEMPTLKKIEDHEKRMREIEIQMPTLALVRGWVITGVIGIIGLFGMALFKMLIP